VERHGSVFLGTILIGLGGVFLLRALDVWPDDVSTWPGVLIVIGVAILVDQIVKGEGMSWFAPLLLIGLGGFFLLRDIDAIDSDFLVPGLLIAAGILVIVSSFRDRPVRSDAIDVPLDGASRARIKIDHGGGELRLGSLALGSRSLCAGSGYGLEQRVKRSRDRVDVSLRQTHRSWMRLRGRSFVIDLAPGVDFELELNTGATDTRIDLESLTVSSLHLKTGASSTRVVAPRQGHTRAEVDAGAASVTFVVPDGVAARISADTGLAEVKVDTRRFPQLGGLYESPDYDLAVDRLELSIKGGVASFAVS
jgi:hypothetical protein